LEIWTQVTLNSQQLERYLYIGNMDI